VYSIYLCAAIGLALGFSGTLPGWWGWGWAILFSFVVFFVAWILLARRLMGRLQPAFVRVQKQMEAGLVDAAMQSLQDMLPMSRWVPMLHSQLMANMGTIAYHTGKTEQAVELLGKASRRSGDAQLMLACIQYRNDEKARAFETLRVASLFSKKHSLLHNTYAWLLNKEGKQDEAMAVLVRLLKKDKNDVPAKENLLRLQNRQRLDMGAFGMAWFALGLERPPQSMGQVQQVRKGFRTPPKRKGG
jgi:tetratricopeptide (TPR) repeat protein